MKLNNVTGHMMLKNEEAYCRQAINAIAPYLNRLIIFDTGSTDKTIEYVKELMQKFPCIELHELQVSGDSIHWDGNHLNQQLTDVRNQMIQMTNTPWIMQIDGDEVYTIDTIVSIYNTLSRIQDNDMYKWVVGLMIKIKWCTSNSEYVSPGPFDRTLRLFRNGGKWIGRFPEEFLYINDQPIHILDRRCITIDNTFLHYSMVLHPERRPPNGEIMPLSVDEIELSRIK